MTSATRTLVLLLLLLAPLTTRAQTAQPRLDPSFGTNGVVRTTFAGQDAYGRGVAVQTDGKIVVVGGGQAAMGAESDVAIVRYLVDGSTDGGFGGNGIVLLDPSNGQYDAGMALVVQPDGRIVAAGITPQPGTGGLSDIIVARLNADGTLDTGFGTNGYAQMNIAGQEDVFGAALQPDGKILVSGAFAAVLGGESGQGVVRFHADGTLDTGFGAGGYQVLGTDRGGVAYGMTVSGSGDIFLIGSEFTDFFAPDPMISKLGPDGSPDGEFGTGGVVILESPGTSEFMEDGAVQSDGKLVVVGFTRVSQPGQLPEIYVARLGTDGSLDPAFGTGGEVRLRIGGQSANGLNVFVTETGDILVFGQYALDTGSFVARLNSDGSLDSEFADGGVLTVPGVSGFWTADLTADGALVATGGAWDDSANRGVMTTARFEVGSVGTEVDSDVGVPGTFALRQNYPNPFNPTTTVVFDVPNAARVQVAAYDLLGRRVRTLVDGIVEAGVHTVPFDAAGLTSGTYLLRMDTPGGVFTRAMALAR